MDFQGYQQNDVLEVLLNYTFELQVTGVSAPRIRFLVKEMHPLETQHVFNGKFVSALGGNGPLAKKRPFSPTLPVAYALP